MPDVHSQITPSVNNQVARFILRAMMTEYDRYLLRLFHCIDADGNWIIPYSTLVNVAEGAIFEVDFMIYIIYHISSVFSFFFFCHFWTKSI